MRFNYRYRCTVICRILLIGILVLCTGCAREDEEEITSFAQLQHSRIGLITGSIQADQAQKTFPEAEFYFFSTRVDLLNALKADKIDAYADAWALSEYMLSTEPEVRVLEEHLSTIVDVAPIFPRTEEGIKLGEQFSEFIRRINETGETDKMHDLWFGSDESLKVIPDLSTLSAKNGTLTVATDATNPPFVYVKDGRPMGYDIDMAYRFCREYGYGLDIIMMDFSGVLPAIIAGKCDFATGGIAKTPEREESVYYAETTYVSYSIVVVRGERSSITPGFFESLSDSFTKTFLREGRWKLFVKGIANTVLITLLSVLFGTILGFAVYLACRSGSALTNKITAAAIWIIQGFPVVVLLMILYYIIFGSIGVSGLFVAVVCFTLIFGTAMFGMLKAGERAVDKGQKEAAMALGYTERRTFFRIILPQAAIHFMPAYRTQVTSLLKATAVVGYIAVQDLTRMGDIVRSRTYEAFFPLIAVSLIYFVLSAVFSRLISRASRYLDPARRSPQQILKGVKRND